MTKRTLISVVVIFLVWMGLDFLIHEILLHPDYSLLSNLYRPVQDAQNYFVLHAAGSLANGDCVCLDLCERERKQTVFGARNSVWSCGCAAHGHPNLFDLLRGPAIACGIGLQANLIQHGRSLDFGDRCRLAE